MSPASPVDIGWLGERHFVSVGGVGFDAYAGARFNAGKRRGVLGYAIAVLPAFVTYRAEMYRLQLDGELLDGRMFLVAFANGRDYGNGLVLADDAHHADGWLNAVIVDDAPSWRQVWRSRRLLIGRRRPTPGITRMKVKHAIVAGERLFCHVDGEAFETHGDLDVRVQPAALLVAGAG
jgi:diacylglycerol kinase family enzyme